MPRDPSTAATLRRSATVVAALSAWFAICRMAGLDVAFSTMWCIASVATALVAASRGDRLFAGHANRWDEAAAYTFLAAVLRSGGA